MVEVRGIMMPNNYTDRLQDSSLNDLPHPPQLNLLTRKHGVTIYKTRIVTNLAMKF
jgi:hypothetical protein